MMDCILRHVLNLDTFFFILAVLYFRHEDMDCSCLIMVKHEAFL